MKPVTRNKIESLGFEQIAHKVWRKRTRFIHKKTLTQLVPGTNKKINEAYDKHDGYYSFGLRLMEMPNGSFKLMSYYPSEAMNIIHDYDDLIISIDINDEYDVPSMVAFEDKRFSMKMRETRSLP